jgi:RHH-type rel operon transcriptional repressor/antitoxin RelB
MTMQITIELSEEAFARLKAAADENGETLTHLAALATEQFLEDIEDVKLAEEILGQIESGEMKTYTLEEVSRKLGLDD